MEMDAKKFCLLDDTKICDACGECDRCDIDPNKLCDNCLKCLAIEDEEFRSIVVDADAINAKKSCSIPRKRGADTKNKRHISDSSRNSGGADSYIEPIEIDPELVAYWEKRLAEYGEAPSDDEFGEIEVKQRSVIYGVRTRKPR